MRNHVLGLWALHGHRRDIWFADLNVQPAFGGNGTGADPNIAISNRQSVQIVGQFQQKRIVDDRAAMVAQRHMFTLTDFATGKITG